MSVLVGKQAPDFTVPAVLGNGEIVDSFTLSSAIKGKYGLVFFYPLDFTFVCPSELIALDNRMSEFKARNVEVIAVSIDSHFTHNAWRNTPVNNGGIGQVRYTMAADIKQDIMKAYDVQSADGVAFRGAFLIDDKGVVRSQIINDLPLGRNMEELIRLVDALQFHEAHGEVCPANWKKGDKGMNASPEGVAAYLTEHAAAL
ncbi:Alkyl hydroperoxide reductase C [Pseudomonas fluorescens]|jgi:peroxiredoxin (alkyl hydroperoxide reductase subunit C)|uniref:Thioredoxin peroxidase n=2 Tax=Pseudomonas fluorescens group TaxID=136843 RepID=A0A0F4SYP2_PSEFL|nr:MULTISPECIES: peroxiredoxin [Pseudomonas]EJM58293.1 peroxiredoxin [Pseudomonas sp. GM48]KJZ37308.1 alkyl hydroperoxide reductase [Pseudomonas fluorescens]MBI3907363.1 peroxiredoxin [Pseudomonas fluorescens]MDR6605171.1 peroxiredoxin (alkyl hydroperoxide reductase subunit C) [Pseudomonas synxantha]CAG8867398.1 Alkyl hydroperoxide reductase C [Pseudomonas fluorescens]